MLNFIKNTLKTSPLYPYYFARKNTLPARLSEAEAQYVKLYAPFVEDGSLVFDVGANIGVRAKIFRHLGCRVIAVEPQRNCVAALKRTFGDSITVIRAAASDHAGAADLHTSEATLISSLSQEWMSATRKSGRFAGFEWNNTERVSLVRIDTLVEKFGQPDFIKIDVEGHELAALKGISKPVAGLSFEFTPEIRQAGVACIEFLEMLGSYRFNFSPCETGELSFAQWMNPEDAKSFLRTAESYGDVFARLGVQA